MAIALSPISKNIGAKVRGIDMSVVPDRETAAALNRAVADHCILVFENQDVTPEQHIAFTKALGDVAYAPGLDRYLHPDHPEIFMVANRDKDGKPLETLNTGRQWHSDQSFMPRPAMGSILHCNEIPPFGGTTMFANMFRAYETLSPAFQAMIDGLKAVHYVYALRDFANRPPPTEEEKAKVPPTAHPMVRTHPMTGRKALYVSEMLTTHIDGMTEEESAAILRYLFDHSVRPEFTYRHHWRPNDVVFWDNRCTMHYAPPDYDLSDPANRRVMYRTTIEGDAPF